MAKEHHQTVTLESLEAKHLKDNEARMAAIAAAHAELRTAEALVAELKMKIAGLQQANMTASFGYDAERARLIEQTKKAA